MVNIPNNKNNVVLITGGARRIGAAIARYFHDKNFNIIIHYRHSTKEATKLAEQLNSIRLNSAKLVQGDLANMVDQQFITSFIQQVLDCYGHVDTLVNNASSFYPTTIGSVSLEQWRDLMVSNVGGGFFLAQGLVPHLKSTKGNIVNISDVHAERPLKNYSVYCIAKAACNMMTKALAKELAPEIRVNGVAPGPCLWPENENILEPQMQSKIVDKTLLKKIANPDDIAQTVFFLATSAYITGQIVAVDGGRSLRI